MARRKSSIVSLFSGALGLDLGLEQAGFEVRVAVECDKFAAETIRQNRPDLPVLEKRIEELTTEQILRAAGLRKGEPTIITAGPSCQAFSTLGSRGSVSDPQGMLFRHFLRVVREARPRFFVMENVKGVLSAAIKHRPLSQRGPGFPALGSDEELGSAFLLILKELQTLGYYVTFDVVNAADYGVPQTRERVLFIGSRDGERVTIPRATHSRDARIGELPWVTLRKGLKGLRDRNPQTLALTPSTKKYLALIPAGGNWRSLPRRMQKKALGAAFDSWGGRSGFLRRLGWKRPCPALTTVPDGKATMMCHPKKLRVLSVREYSRIQQFPDSWVFSGGLPQQYRQVGNAVPPGIGKAVGRMLKTTMKRNRPGSVKHTLVCASDDLIRRISERPKTILNPIRMRKVKSTKASAKWMSKSNGRRSEILKYASNRRVA
jgi:DNA (cytosine-5)-methyltransferase 1